MSIIEMVNSGEFNTFKQAGAARKLSVELKTCEILVCGKQYRVMCYFFFLGSKSALSYENSPVLSLKPPPQKNQGFKSKVLIIHYWGTKILKRWKKGNISNKTQKSDPWKAKNPKLITNRLTLLFNILKPAGFFNTRGHGRKQAKEREAEEKEREGEEKLSKGRVPTKLKI